MTHKNEHEEVEILHKYCNPIRDLTVYEVHTSHDEYRLMDEQTFNETYRRIK